MDWTKLEQSVNFWQSGWGVPVIFPMGAQDTDFEFAESLMSDDNYVAEPKEDGNHYMFAGGRCFGRKPSADKKKPELMGYPVEKTDNVPHLAEFFADYPKLVVVGEIYYPGFKSNTVTKIMGCAPEKALMRQGFGTIFKGSDFKPGTLQWRHDWYPTPGKVDEDTLTFLKLGLGEIKFMIFDILFDDTGRPLHSAPWYTRRAALAAFYEGQVKTRYYDDIIHLSPVYYGTATKRKKLAEIEAAGGEGIVLKNKNAPYVMDTAFSESPGKKPMHHWFKRKTETDDDVVILGFVEGKKTDKGGKHVGRVGSIRVGQYVAATYDQYSNELDRWDKHDDDVFGKSWKPLEVFDGSDSRNYFVLQEVGTVGSGYDDAERQAMWNAQHEYIGKVIRVKAMERTEKGKFRHARLDEWREDKAPEQCIFYPAATREGAEHESR